MKEYPNFYENVKEAMLRLRRTVVLYDGAPYSVVCITNHKSDGKFRIYLEPIGLDGSQDRPQLDNFPPEHPGIGAYLDQWLAEHKNSPIIRKSMDSPLFNKFRPYPLGMCNYGTGAMYLERQPNRKTEQGLTASMLCETVLSLDPQPIKRVGSISVYGKQFRDCVLGKYPSAMECLQNLLDPDIENTAVAFDRKFGLVRGPIDMIFLAYKGDIVGVLPRNNFSEVRLGRDFKHVKEVAAELGLFQIIG
jgi:hypothetical protein